MRDEWISLKVAAKAFSVMFKLNREDSPVVLEFINYLDEGEVGNFADLESGVLNFHARRIAENRARVKPIAHFFFAFFRFFCA